ncbi:MAG: acetylxylan esterase [Candidatus Glassbacteria bacterium]|nr:acetylxylan esterase [Candidatus Glassbacteria bacterium]
MKAFLYAVATVCLAAVSLRAAGPPPEAFRVLDPAPRPGRQITPYLHYQLEAAWRQDDLRKTRLAAIRTETDLLQLQREVRRSLLESIGGLPGGKAPLNARVTGTIRLDGYRIEKLIFESLPGFHVTALVYLPDGPPMPRPAVLVSCGHSSIGKAYTGYQQISARLAKRGYVVLCWDPVGQGERSQFWDSKKNDSRYNRVCGEHAILGNLAYLAGTSLARWEIWDGMRALDYLLTRPEVDRTRISITGTSGGGFQSSHIAALDQGIIAAAPSCYICSMPMRMANRIFADPDSDPEQDLYRMISAGVDHSGLLLLIYPRPLIVCAAVEDFFPIEGTRKTFREIEEVYCRFGRPEKIALTEGYHRHSFSSQNQENAFAFLDRFNRMPVRHTLDSTRVLEEKELWCTASGQARLDFRDGKSLMELIREYYLERKENVSLSLAETYRGDLYPGIDSWPVEAWQEIPPELCIAWEAAGSSEAEGVAIDRYLLHHSRMLAVPVLHFHRKAAPAGKILLWFGSNGKAAAGDWPEIRKYLDQGFQVVSFDFRALGENRMQYKVYSIDDPRLAEVDLEKQYASPLSGVLANYVYNSLLTGRPYFLQMIEDAEIVSRFVREKLGGGTLQVTAGGEAYTLAAAVAEVLPGVGLLDRPGGETIRWSGLVDRMSETWPIQYLLPYGAYIH